MEAAGLYENFENNLMTIQKGLRSKVNYQKTALPEALPIELAQLTDALNSGGANIKLTATDLKAVDEFIEQFRANHAGIMAIIRQQLDDKRTVMWVEGTGSLLVKEVVIRRLEYINEAAALLDTMMLQLRIGNQRVLVSYNEVLPSPNKKFGGLKN